MPGVFLHSPQKVVAKLLLARGLVTDPAWWLTHQQCDADATRDWPGFANTEPNDPDNCITVYRAADRLDARILSTGQNVKHLGITVRVRGATDDVAFAKVQSLEVDLTERATDQTVTLGSQQYLVQSFPQVSQIAGFRSAPGSDRWVYTLNCLAVILPHPIQG